MEATFVDFLTQFFVMATVGGFGYLVFKIHNDASEEEKAE
ncbi:hypothetical protein JCM19029_09250 [Salinicoccus sesuvii]